MFDKKESGVGLCHTPIKTGTFIYIPVEVHFEGMASVL